VGEFAWRNHANLSLNCKEKREATGLPSNTNYMTD
jgi:hypothetical protein